jgi:hypothetical protein
VSSFLAKGDGSISTTAHSSVKSKAKKADEEDDEEYMSPQDDDPDEDAENTSEIRKAFTLASTFRNSGSVLITLRDAVPYTLWSVFTTSHFYHPINEGRFLIHTGIFPV